MASGGQSTAVRKTATATRTQPAAVPVVRTAPPSRPQLMSTIRVSSPTDAAEHEARSVAARVMSAPAPSFQSPYVSRFAGAAQAARSAARPAAPAVGPSAAARITSLLGGGQPLPKDVKDFMEPRFGADFSGVRIHASESSAKLSNELSAQAFTVGNNVFFSRGAYQPQSREGRELIAHELTHTIQQGAAPQRSAQNPVAMRVDRQVQRLGISDALDYFADKANYIPGFRMFTIIIGVNPINMAPVSRSAGNVLRAIIEFVPGGALLTEAMANHGVFDKADAWVEQQISSLGMTGRMFKDALSQFIDSLSWRDIFHLGDVWDRAKRIFTTPIDRLISFIKGLAIGILNLIKDAILRPLAKLAEGTRGYDLLKAVLGRDPITGDPVPRTADTLIGGFMRLIGQEDVWENMKKANAVARCFAWFQGALSALMGFVAQIPQLAIQAFRSLEVADVILIPRALLKVAAVFGNFIGRFITWAGNAVWNLLEIVFDAVSPGAWGYIKKTGAALKSILKNPLPFVGNLVKAAKLGFTNFVGRFLTHLKTGLLDWLTGSLPGIYIPKAFDLREIVMFVLSVLGLTWANIRQKLVKVVGEPVVVALEKGFDIVVTLVRDGPAAAWDKIKEQLGSLKDMVISGIMDMVLTTVVQKAVPKLIAMFIPGAGFISAIISIYDTIMVFVNKIKQIIAVVKSFVDSIVAIAGGAIGAAATRVEAALAGGLSLAINFLAGFIGLGKVADKVMGVIQKIRAPIDKALDWLINFIVTTAKKIFSYLFGGPNDKAAAGQQGGPVGDVDKPVRVGGESHTIRFHLDGNRVVIQMASGAFDGMRTKLSAIAAPHIDKLRAKGASAMVAEVEKRVAALGELVDRGQQSAAKKLADVADPFKRASILKNDAEQTTRELSAGLDKLGEFLATGAVGDQLFGEASKLEPKQAIRLKKSGEVLVVREVRKLQVVSKKEPELTLVCEALDHSYKRVLVYHEMPDWELQPTPAAEKFQPRGSVGGRVVVDAGSLNSGARPSHDPPFLNQSVGARQFAVRGHVVAFVFGGPGGRNNIVALTTATNNRMQQQIEVPLAKQIRAGAVYEYRGRVTYPGGDPTQPVESVVIEADRIFPDKVPTKLTYEVDNK